MTSKPTLKQYAGALLLTPEGKVIMQQRDNKPGIMNPGQITTFGGAVEEGETPDRAIIRELKEELSLDYLQPELYKVFNKTLAIHGEDREMHIYLVHNVNPGDLSIHEGAGYIEIAKGDGLNNLPLTKLANEILTAYFKQ